MSILSIDETTGQQTSTSELSSFTAGNLPVIFQNVLTAIDAADTTDIGTISGISVSGYADPGATTGTTFTNFTGDVNDVGFVDSAGDPFNGDASGLKTTDGTSVTLWTYADNNNVLLGRRADDGTVVFAAYLDTLKSDDSIANVAAGTDIGATKAKLWLVQYETLQHIVSGAPVDVVSLAGILNLGVNTTTEFDATGAPAGNNLFLLMGDGDPVAGEAGLIVTGMAPANESTGASVSSGSTVNTSKGGGETTIGTDNQMIVPDKGLYFTFVKLSADSIPVTIPQLDHGEATDESSIKFDDYLTASRATFTVVQVQPPKAATVKLTAINNEEMAAATDQDDFIDDILTTLADDAHVNIYAVTVVRTGAKGKNPVNGTFEFQEGGTTSHAGADLTLDFTGSSVVIKGIIAGDVITYSTGVPGTPANHNRLLVENAGTVSNYDAGFDIGDFSIAGGSLTKVGLDALDFYDDIPSVDPNTATASLTTDDTNVITSAGPTSFAGLFSAINFGNDGFKDSDNNGVQDSDAVVYTLGLGGTEPLDSGLLETISGDKIYLYLESGVVTGRVGLDDDGGANAAGAIAFTISVDATNANVTLTQNLAFVHNDPADAVESGASAASMAAGAVTLTVTVKDNDLDTDTAVRNIGDMFHFEDDGPSITVSTNAVPSLVTDDTEITDTAGPTSFAGVFNAPNFGKDGFKDADDNNVQDSDAVSYSLVASLTGADSTLVDTLSGKKIFLFLQGGFVNGRVADATTNTADAAGAIAFTISVNATNANVTLTQIRSIVHNDPLDAIETGASAAVMTTADLVGLKATVTDGDLDTSSATRDITAAFAFEDDGPAVAFGNLVGTGTADPQYGYWTRDPGSDGLAGAALAAALDIAVTNFTLVRPDSTTTTGTFSDPLTGSVDGSGNPIFSGSLTGDFDNNAGTPNQTVNFTLTAFANGTYQLDLASGFASTISTVSTVDGLTAGGPDPVQTLTPGAGLHPPAPQNDKQIVFFNVLVEDTESEIESLIGGTPDLTEAQIEGNSTLTALLGTEAMNVSTSGIGVGNNNLNGDDTSSSGVDESFVANPEFDVTKVKVYIDNSVSGYTPATESLLYTLYYTDGTTSGAPVKVLAGDLIAGAKSNDPVHFEAQAAAGKIIDAVQLTMDSGTIKVPYIEFVTVTPNLANDVQLAFRATLTDGDGDTATSAFLANLFANELAGSFDYVLAGTSGADAFNIDLPDVKNTYQVNSFAVGTDKLVLAGNNTYSIGTSGGNTVVDITETAGGQHTFVTVMGVTLTTADIATIV